MPQYSQTTLAHMLKTEGVTLVDAVAQLGQEEEAQRQLESAAVTSARILSGGCVAGGLGLFVASALGPAGFAVGAGLLGWTAAGILAKPGNHRARTGERYLMNTSGLRHWVVMAWQAGYPVGQIVAAYDSYCEAVGRELQFKRPAIAPGGSDFVSHLNRTPDAVSKLPPVTKIGNSPRLQPPDESLPVSPPKPTPPMQRNNPNGIPIAPPEVMARYQARMRQQQASEPQTNPASEAIPVQVLEKTYQEAVADAADEVVTTARAKTAIELLQQQQFQSRAFFGAQRTGKTYLAACASRLLDCRTYFVNLAAFVNPESGCEAERYFGSGERTCIADLAVTFDLDEAADVIDSAIRLVQNFLTDPEPSILIFDEWVTIAARTHQHSPLLAPLIQAVASAASGLASSGKQRRKAIWMIAPQLVASDLTQAGKVIKTLDLCYVSIPPGRSLYWHQQRIGFSQELFDQMRNNYGCVTHPGRGWDCDRIAQVGGRWLPVGDLPQL